MQGVFTYGNMRNEGLAGPEDFGSIFLESTFDGATAAVASFLASGAIGAFFSVDPSLLARGLEVGVGGMVEALTNALMVAVF